MGSDVGLIFPTASLHRDHSILYALVCEKRKFRTAFCLWEISGRDNCIQNFYLGRYISSDIRSEIKLCGTRERSHKTRFPNVYPTIYLLKWNFEYGYSHSKALQFELKLERCKPQSVLAGCTFHIFGNHMLRLSLHYKLYNKLKII